MDYKKLQEIVGFSDAVKVKWCEDNAHHYADIEEAWNKKLEMHAFPPRSAAVRVMPSYRSPITGKWIDTPAQRREDLARSGSRPWEGIESERKVAQERVKAEEKASDAAIENAAVAAWHSLGDDKKRALENSL
jgi:hypothetical protein